MSAVRNILFDLDGTLLDSRFGIFAGLRRTLSQMGHELPADAPLDWAIGPPLVEVMARLLATFGDGRVQEAVEHYRAWYGGVGLFDANPYPGVPELLERLTAMGKTLFVATSKRTDFARQVLAHFDLARRFRVIQGVEADGRFNNKADLIRFLLQTEELQSRETVVVGDREHDVLAARANGLRVIAAAYGYGSREELLQAGAEILCDSPEQVGRMLQS